MDIKNFESINYETTILFITKDNATMKSVCNKVKDDLENLTGEVKCREVLLKDDNLLRYENFRKPIEIDISGIENEIASLHLSTWFNKCDFYSYEFRGKSLKGIRAEVVVIDDNIRVDKDWLNDCIDPLGSEQGSFILLSEFFRSKNPTKYTKQMKWYLLKPHDKAVVDTIVEEYTNEQGK